MSTSCSSIVVKSLKKFLKYSPLSAHIVNSIDTTGWTYDVFVNEGYAYVADGDGGLQVIDIEPPESPEIKVSAE